jgi:hypothetical protein
MPVYHLGIPGLPVSPVIYRHKTYEYAPNPPFIVFHIRNPKISVDYAGRADELLPTFAPNSVSSFPVRLMPLPTITHSFPTTLVSTSLPTLFSAPPTTRSRRCLKMYTPNALFMTGYARQRSPHRGGSPLQPTARTGTLLVEGNDVHALNRHCTDYRRISRNSDTLACLGERGWVADHATREI